GPFATRGAATARPGARRRVYLLADLVHGLLQRILGGPDARDIVGGQGRAHIGDLGLDIALHVARDLIAQITQRLLCRVGGAVGLVARLPLFAALAVLVRVRLRLAHHLVDLVLGKPAGRLDGDALLAPGALVVRLHVDDAVGVDVELHLDLRDAARCGR